MFCCTLLYVHSNIAIILMEKRDLVALLNLSSWCLVMVEWLFLAVPWGCLRFVIVVFPDHTHLLFLKVSKGAKIRNRYNQVPHLTQDTNGKVTYSQLDSTNESQEFSPFPAGDHKAHINRRAKRHSKHKTEKKTYKIHKRSTALERPVKYFT